MAVHLVDRRYRQWNLLNHQEKFLRRSASLAWLTPKGKTILFKRDKGMCVEMPYIDLRDYKQGLVLIETIRKNMGGFTCEEIEGAKLSGQTQGQVGNPPDAVFKQLIGTKELKNNPVTLENVASQNGHLWCKCQQAKGCRD